MCIRDRAYIDGSTGRLGIPKQLRLPAKDVLQGDHNVRVPSIFHQAGRIAIPRDGLMQPIAAYPVRKDAQRLFRCSSAMGERTARIDDRRLIVEGNAPAITYPVPQ